MPLRRTATEKQNSCLYVSLCVYVLQENLYLPSFLSSFLFDNSLLSYHRISLDYSRLEKFNREVLFYFSKLSFEKGRKDIKFVRSK